MAGDAQGNRLPGGQEAFPGQAGKALLELGEGGGVEKIAQPGQDAAGGAQVQVGAVEGGQVAFEEYAAGFFRGRSRGPARAVPRAVKGSSPGAVYCEDMSPKKPITPPAGITRFSIYFDKYEGEIERS